MIAIKGLSEINFRRYLKPMKGVRGEENDNPGEALSIIY